MSDESGQFVPASTREKFRRILRHENAMLIIILVVITAALAALTQGRTLTRANTFNMLLNTSVRGIASIGQLFVILTAGIDLSVGGLAIFAMCLGGLWTTTGGSPVSAWQPVNSLPFGLAVFLMLIVGIGFGAFNGVFVSRLRVPPLIVTLALSQILAGLSYNATQGYTIFNIHPSLNFFGMGRVAGVPVPVIVFIAVAVVAYFVLHHTTFGRSVYATGGNPMSSWLSGLNVSRILLTSYIISGFLAALSGFILLARMMAASMNAIKGLELDSIAAVVVGGVSLAGGRGTLVGVVIGTIILGAINNGMNVMAVDPAYQDIVKGVIIIVAVTIDMIRRR
jgi:ribose/xylose/arabinose/galactoside ABC-type transport system permease subunit